MGDGNLQPSEGTRLPPGSRPGGRSGAFGALAYGIAGTFGASGFVGVYLTGVLVGALLPQPRRATLGFHEALANAAEIGLFLLLGLFVFPSRLPPVALSGLLVAIVLTVVARPVAVWVCTLGQGDRWRERSVFSVGGLKGAVPIVLATFPLTAGVDGADLIFDVVIFPTGDTEIRADDVLFITTQRDSGVLKRLTARARGEP